MPHLRLDYLLCELGTGNLRSLIVHLSEGATGDSGAHREFTMFSKSSSLPPGLIFVHGTALRPEDFAKMTGVGLVWSPRSNDELYGSTTNIAAAQQAKISVSIAPDWSPSGSAGVMQEIAYAARHHFVASDQLIEMATSSPARMSRTQFLHRHARAGQVRRLHRHRRQDRHDLEKAAGFRSQGDACGHQPGRGRRSGSLRGSRAAGKISSAGHEGRHPHGLRSAKGRVSGPKRRGRPGKELVRHSNNSK